MSTKKLAFSFIFSYFSLALILKIIYNNNRVRLMNEIILEDIDGNKTKATFLFTHFDYNFSKNILFI